MKKILFSLLLLTGCGFTPLYSQNDDSLKDTKIIVDPIPNQYGNQMRQIIQKALYSPSENPTNQYRLIVSSPSFDVGDRTITTDEFASTMQITGKATYQLKNLKTDKTSFTGNVAAVSSYSVVTNPYATTVAQKSIQDELSKQLAEQISLDVLAKLSQEQK